jgi:hypothetical protein
LQKRKVENLREIISELEDYFMKVKKISVENGPAGKPILKVTDSKNRIHTFESDAAAAVPDTTKDSGPDVMQMQEDAQKPHDAANAEYDAAAKNPDTPQAVEKANESWFNALFGLEDGSEEPETPAEPPAAPDTPSEPPAAPETSDTETVANNVGEVTATDENTLEIDLGDEVMVIKPKEDASEPAPAPAASADCGGAAPSASGQAAGATATESLNQTFEDFLKGL